LKNRSLFTYSQNDQNSSDQNEPRLPLRPLSAPPSRKESYESSRDVQHWLQEEAVGNEGIKPPFDPQFLIGRRDRSWILSSLAHFYEQNLITDIVSMVKSGKEATVYCCTAHPATGKDWLAAKIYRPRMFRNLRNDEIYRQNRPERDEHGRTVRHTRRGAARNTDRTRALQVSSWIEYEYRTIQLLYDAGATIPQPFSQIGNAILMEYIGDSDAPAPLLHEVTIEHNEAETLFEDTMRNIQLWLECSRIHGDLSAYNMLYMDGRVITIDFAQAVDPQHNPNGFDLLQRDIERVTSYFSPFGVEADPYQLAVDMWDVSVGGR